MAKAFSIEDGNLAKVPLTSSVTRLYKDIDLTFAKRSSGDIFKKTDAAAVKQSVKNILMTNPTEKPFDPYFGGGLNEFLFELSEEFSELDIQEQVAQAIENYEPRARVKAVNVSLNPDFNSMTVNVEFTVITTLENVVLEVDLVRLR
jgi:phage baseplate assembly protein W